MFRACHDSSVVEANLDAVVAKGAQYDSGFDDSADENALLAAQLRETQEMLRVARDELRNIATAKRFDPKVFENGDEFADWARSRARHALAAIGEVCYRPIGLLRFDAVGDTK